MKGCCTLSRTSRSFRAPSTFSSSITRCLRIALSAMIRPVTRFRTWYTCGRGAGGQLTAGLPEDTASLVRHLAKSPAPHQLE